MALSYAIKLGRGQREIRVGGVGNVRIHRDSRGNGNSVDGGVGEQTEHTRIHVFHVLERGRDRWGERRGESWSSTLGGEDCLLRNEIRDAGGNERDKPVAGGNRKRKSGVRMWTEVESRA